MKCFPCLVHWNSSARLAGLTKLSASAQHLPEIINTQISHRERLVPLHYPRWLVEERVAARGSQNTPVLYFILRQRNWVELKKVVFPASLALHWNNLVRGEGQQFLTLWHECKFLLWKNIKKLPCTPLFPAHYHLPA